MTAACEFVTASRMQVLAEALRVSDCIGIDTEFARETTYYPRLCLVQVATAESVFCADPLGDESLEAFWDTILDSSWVIHAARQDIEVVYLVSGRMPREIFDTQVAAGLVGYAPQLGYAALVAELFGAELPKAHTRADWSQRPLPPELLEYAVEDVQYLLPAYERLGARLEELGRLQWALEDSRDLLDETLYAANPEGAVLRLKGTGRLSGRARAAAAALAEWREREALARDRPRQWILKDATIVEIATLDPEDRAALYRVPGLPAKTVRRAGKDLLGLLAEARRAALPDEPPPRVDEAALRARLKPMQAAVAKVAAELDIAPEVIASRKELLAALSGERGLRVFRGWRREVVGEALLALA